MARAGEWGREMNFSATIRDPSTPQPELFSLYFAETRACGTERSTVLEKGCCELQDEVARLRTLRNHLVFEMDAVMKELMHQLIGQFLVNVITVYADVAQDVCHATTV